MVERLLPKQDIVGSTPITRSLIKDPAPVTSRHGVGCPNLAGSWGAGIVAQRRYTLAALPSFISTAEAAHRLGISEARVRHMIEAGTIKAANISGETIVSEAIFWAPEKSLKAWGMAEA